MCLAIPGKVIDITMDAEGIPVARTSFGGAEREVSLEYTPDVQPGDYVLVHVGFALGKVDEADAARTYALLEQIREMNDFDSGVDVDAS